MLPQKTILDQYLMRQDPSQSAAILTLTKFFNHSWSWFPSLFKKMLELE